MLMPKKIKRRKVHRGRRRGKATRGAVVKFGEFGLQALECGKVWIRIFPDKPITKKPAETRMGKGKGAPEEWVAVVRPGRILYEMEGVSEELARDAMRLAASKLPIRTRVTRRLEKEI